MIFATSPDTHYLEEHAGGLLYFGWKESFDATEVETLECLYGLVRFLKPNLIVETGTLLGHGAFALARACADNGRGRVVSCDINEKSLGSAQERYGTTPALEFRLCDSLRLPELREADFIFSDSSYRARTEEFKLAKPGAFFAVHDTHVYPALEDFVLANGGFLLDRGRGLGLLSKKVTHAT